VSGRVVSALSDPLAVDLELNPVSVCGKFGRL